MITGNFIRSDRSMNPYYMIKEEYPIGCSAAAAAEAEEVEGLMMMTPPRPMEGLQETGPAPFLMKTYEMVDDPNTNEVFWSREGGSFVVWDPQAFSTALLPRHFKHSNFSSFVRQLNAYGFRKIDPDRWEFANEGFLRGQRHLLKSIKRRKAPSQPLPPPPQAPGPCVEVGRFGIDGEFEHLMGDKQVLMMELVKLRQQQQNTRAYLQAMEQRLQGTEKKQQQMMCFLARAMPNPAFLQQLVQQKEKRKELEEAMTKKRRKPIDQGPSDQMNSIKAEPLEYDDCGFGISELEALALEMQGYGRTRREQEGQEDMEPLESGDRELDEGFWEDLLNERLEGELGDAEDVTVLADHFGYLD